jgi:hypothetical protein
MPRLTEMLFARYFCLHPMNARTSTPIRPVALQRTDQVLSKLGEGGRVFAYGYVYFGYRFNTGTSG